MSVRNILDGTIKVGGGAVSGDEKYIDTLTVMNFHRNACYTSQIENQSNVYTSAVVADSIELQAGSERKPIAYIRDGDKTNVTANNLIAETSITTPSLTLNEEEVLVSKRADVTLVAKATYVGDTTATYQAKVASKILDLTPSLHVLSVITSLSSCKTMKSLIINTGFKLDGKSYRAFGTTVCKVGDAYLDAYVDLYMENSFLYAKLTFKETPEYTSMEIKNNMIFC